ncbi:17754_t:CDS:1, partial [Acaulospora morrowiae]
MEFEIQQNNFILSDDDTTTDIKNSSNNKSIQSVTSVIEWKNLISQWVDMLEDEIQDQEEEIIKLVNNFDISLDNINQIQHPAIDIEAKWVLQDIFINTLETLYYLDDFIT